MSAIRSRSPFRTTEGFSPRRMRTIPSTASSSSLRVTIPWRGAYPIVTRPTFLTVTGTPPFEPTRTSSTSFRSLKMPRLRITNIPLPRST